MCNLDDNEQHILVESLSAWNFYVRSYSTFRQHGCNARERSQRNTITTNQLTLSLLSLRHFFPSIKTNRSSSFSTTLHAIILVIVWTLDPISSAKIVPMFFQLMMEIVFVGIFRSFFHIMGYSYSLSMFRSSKIYGFNCVRLNNW